MASPYTLAEEMYLCNCWEIIRKDGTILRVTDADEDVTWNFLLFSSMGGFNATAEQKPGGLRDRSREVAGVIEAEAISHSDLRAGFYRDALVIQRLVDWTNKASTFAVLTNYYWIEDVTFSGEQWEAKLGGISNWLTKEVGRTYTRTCRHDLGDLMCGIDLAPLTGTGTVSAIGTQRWQFNTTGVPAADRYWTFGNMTWLTGNNVGIVSEVKKFASAGSQFQLWLRTPFDIQVGDTFEVTPGCDKLVETCVTVFDNIVNFGGFPFIPGTDKMYMTPDAKV